MEIHPVAQGVCSYPVREGNKVTPLVDSLPFYQRIGQAILEAKHSVWIVVSFIAKTQQIPYKGKIVPIWDVIDDATNRNLDVRVLFWRNSSFVLGNTGVFSGTESDFDELRKRRSTYLIRWDDSEDSNHCHHEKTWIFDAGHESELAFTGGIVLGGGLSNIRHEPSPLAVKQIHDIMVEIAGPAVTDIHHSFVQRWNEANGHQGPLGSWPNLVCAKNLPFPLHLVHRTYPAGNSRVQIQRTIRKNSYTVGFPPPGGHPFNISDGEASIYEQYVQAIKSAKETIYIENQHIAHDFLLELLAQAAGRGVRVFYLVPGQGMGAAVAVKVKTDAWKKQYFTNNVLVPNSPPPPKYGSVFLEKLPALSKSPNFCLAGLVWQGSQGFSHVYVHSKMMIVDNKWFTVGSANLVDISFEKDHTELNASVWDPEVATNLFNQLIEEHTFLDLSKMPASQALEFCHKLAFENLDKIKNGQKMQGNLFALDPNIYCDPLSF